jgi:hypothetical protein
MYLNPARMDAGQQARIARWLEANGCRHWIALEPIIVRGNVAEYVALARKDDRSLDRQIHGNEITPLGRKRLRLRIPLRRVA